MMLRFWTPLLLIAFGFAWYALESESAQSLPAPSTQPTLVAYRVPTQEEAPPKVTEQKATEQKAQTQYEKLDAEFRTAMAAFSKKVTAIKDKKQQVAMIVAENPARDFAKRFMGLAKQHPGTKAALNSTLFAVCLLYTSPSPRDGLLSRMPSSA